MYPTLSEQSWLGNSIAAYGATASSSDVTRLRMLRIERMADRAVRAVQDGDIAQFIELSTSATALAIAERDFSKTTLEGPAL